MLIENDTIFQSKILYFLIFFLLILVQTTQNKMLVMEPNNNFNETINTHKFPQTYFFNINHYHESSLSTLFQLQKKIRRQIISS